MNETELKQKLAKEEEARKMQFIIREICWQKNNVVGEIKSWKKIRTREDYIDIHIQNKKIHLKQLLHQKIMFTEALSASMQTGEIAKPYEIVRKSEKLRPGLAIETLERMLNNCLNE